MAFKGWKEFLEEQEKLREKYKLTPEQHPYLPLSGLEYCRPEFIELAQKGEPLPKYWWDRTRMNSYERQLLLHLATDEALIAKTEYSVQNSRRMDDWKGIATTYDEAVIHLFTKELIKRLRAAEAQLEELSEIRRTAAEHGWLYRGKISDWIRGKLKELEKLWKQ